jgi:hypothetical protein
MPRMMVTQREVVDRIRNEEAFVLTTGSMRGDKAFDDNGWTYYITSYGVDVGRIRHEQTKHEDGSITWETKLWVTPQRYSVTTSRHTGYVRRALNIPRTK